jgi:hypothetical protein
MVDRIFSNSGFQQLFEKIAISLVLAGMVGYIGGRLFMSLARHLLLKYFDGMEAKVRAAFTRIDEHRKEFGEFKMGEYRDAKRDFALELNNHRKDLKELYNRTDNHGEVRACIEYCRKKNMKRMESTRDDGRRGTRAKKRKRV